MRFSEYILLFLIVAAVAYIIFKPKDKPKTIIKIDRDTVTVRDTIIQKDTLTIERVKSILDTVFINNQNVKVAKADTVINNDSVRVKVDYYYDPLNYFDIEVQSLKEKIIEKFRTVTEIKTVEVDEPIYKEKSFYGMVAAIFIIILEIL